MTTGLDRWNRVCECGHPWAGHSLLDPDEGTRCFECDCQEFFAAQDVAGLDRRNLPAGVGEARPARPLQINPDPLAVVERHDDVSAVNWIRGRSREDRLRVWVALGGTEDEFPDPAVGEARPAEPPEDRCDVCKGVNGHAMDCPVGAPAEEQPDARAKLDKIEAEMNAALDAWQEERTDFQAEAAGLREQLDAALAHLDATRLDPWTRISHARAALGVVAKTKLPSVDDHPGYDGDK